MRTMAKWAFPTERYARCAPVAAQWVSEGRYPALDAASEEFSMNPAEAYAENVRAWFESDVVKREELEQRTRRLPLRRDPWGVSDVARPECLEAVATSVGWTAGGGLLVTVQVPDCWVHAQRRVGLLRWEEFSYPDSERMNLIGAVYAEALRMAGLDIPDSTETLVP